jgi:putative redox protein
MSANLRFAELTWQDGLTFTAGAPEGPQVTLDGDGERGPSPVVTLLAAAGACTGSDIVLILEKMRAGLSEFRMAVRGTRRETDPRRLVALHLTIHLRGSNLDEVRARRAVDLSLGKYCSVVHSLAPDIAISYDLVLA